MRRSFPHDLPAFPPSLFNHSLRPSSVDRVTGWAEVRQRIEGVVMDATAERRAAARSLQPMVPPVRRFQANIELVPPS